MDPTRGFLRFQANEGGSLSRRLPVFALTVSGPGCGERWLPITQDRFVVGRGAQANLRVEGAGVWDRHLSFEIDRAEGLIARCEEGAMAMVEGRPIQRHRVRNGDELTLGAFRVRISLAPTRRRSVGMWEAFFWMVFAGMLAAQVGVGWWLFRG